MVAKRNSTRVAVPVVEEIANLEVIAEKSVEEVKPNSQVTKEAHPKTWAGIVKSNGFEYLSLKLVAPGKTVEFGKEEWE